MHLTSKRRRRSWRRGKFWPSPSGLTSIAGNVIIPTGWTFWSDSWVGLTLNLAVPPSVWFCLRYDGKLAELAEQLGKIVEHHRSKSTQPNYPTRWTTLFNVHLHVWRTLCHRNWNISPVRRSTTDSSCKDCSKLFKDCACPWTETIKDHLLRTSGTEDQECHLYYCLCSYVD